MSIRAAEEMQLDRIVAAIIALTSINPLPSVILDIRNSKFDIPSCLLLAASCHLPASFLPSVKTPDW